MRCAKRRDTAWKGRPASRLKTVAGAGFADAGGDPLLLGRAPAKETRAEERVEESRTHRTSEDSGEHHARGEVIRLIVKPSISLHFVSCDRGRCRQHPSGCEWPVGCCRDRVELSFFLVPNGIPCSRSGCVRVRERHRAATIDSRARTSSNFVPPIENAGLIVLSFTVAARRCESRLNKLPSNNLWKSSFLVDLCLSNLSHRRF